MTESILGKARTDGYREGWSQASMLTHDDAYARGYMDAKSEAPRRDIWFLAGAIFGSFAWLLGQML